MSCMYETVQEIVAVGDNKVVLVLGSGELVRIDCGCPETAAEFRHWLRRHELGAYDFGRTLSPRPQLAVDRSGPFGCQRPLPVFVPMNDAEAAAVACGDRAEAKARAVGDTVSVYIAGTGVVEAEIVGLREIGDDNLVILNMPRSAGVMADLRLGDGSAVQARCWRRLPVDGFCVRRESGNVNYECQ